MRLVLLSGGSGKRLWPLSNDARSKQFLKVLKKNNGTNTSMVERVWDQLKKTGLHESTVIATSLSQVDMIKSQLEYDVPLIVEPERRDTFPAIALAASYLYTVKKMKQEEILSVLPVDPYVHEDFFFKVSKLENLLKISNANVGLIGVKPTYPSSKYGYIVPNKDEAINYINVSHFVEKPLEENATELIKENALWNTGVFAFKLGYVLDILLDKGFPINYFELIECYSNLPCISFDYEVVENADKIAALSYEGYWKDLGTWNTLTEEMSKEILGKGVISEDSKNVHIINELDIPIVALGLRNIVIVASPDGVLVTEKAASPQIKELLKGFTQRPMYEERRWGWYQVNDYAQYADGKEMLTKRLSIFAGKNISYQYHKTRNEVWTVVKGNGEFVLDDKIHKVYPGDVLKIPASAKHSLRAVTSMEIIEVQTGFNLVEEDNFRIYESWEKIINHCLALK